MKRTFFKKILGKSTNRRGSISGNLASIFAFLLFAFSGVARSQVSSTAFDPNCYFPRIGVPGEIDTIYGGKWLENLGAGLVNLGPNINGTYGEIAFADSSAGLSVFKSWPDFSLHKLRKTRNLYLSQYYRNYQFGHFHSTKYLDILATDDGGRNPARIYWQDDKGEYDSTRYTILLSPIQGKTYNDYSSMRPSYLPNLSSDSIQDIISMIVIADSNETGKSYLLYFKGESLRNQAKTAYADSTAFFDIGQRVTVSGDFRGTGRIDMIAADNYVKFGQNYHNLFYYRNDPPFSMSRLLNSLKYDTLFAQWQNPNNYNNLNAITMSALSKQSGDSSNDFLLFFATDYGRPQAIEEFRIFRGGKDFGSNRWTADSAAFVLHAPYYYDPNYHALAFGYGLKDCGHMTGTKNHVLYIEGLLDGGFYGYEFFYVLGDAIDDKVDMFIGPIGNGGGASNQVDTIVADNDNLQDIIMGESGFGLDAADAHGSIYVIHGSRKIPERTRTVSTGVSGIENISIFPNPVTEGKFTLDLSSIEQQNLKVELWDLLGRKVYSEYIGEAFIRQFYSIFIPSLSSGTYILEIIGKKFTKRMEVHVLK